MPGLPSCDPAPRKPCPERFRASASEWIDRNNFGDLPDGKLPPGGIRLRWDWPLTPLETGGAAGMPAFPQRFTVLRHGPLNPEQIVKPQATVGHMPRMFAPRALWKTLNRVGDRDFVVGAEPCAAAQAVHIAMEPLAERVSIALIDTAGETKLTGELGGGDVFYYELADIHRVTFSAPPSFVFVEGLSLSASDADTMDLAFTHIATLDARAWLRASLAEISERMASDQLPPFVTIQESDWQELQQHGQDLVTALDAGAVPLEQDIAHFQLATAMRWELASLIAWGFLDGEHIAGPAFDRIDSALMLSPASQGSYIYQIVAEFDEAGHADARSDIALTVARPMPALSGALVRPTVEPRTRSELVNLIDETPVGPPEPAGPPVEQTFCTTNWEIEARAPYDELIFTSPRAAESQIVSDRVEEAGEFSADGARRPARFRGMERIELRDHVFRVPFYDCDIWLELAAGDCWDRRIAQPPTPPVQPEIDYEGRCIGIAGGTCNPIRGTAELRLDLSARPAWVADPLATAMGGVIELMIKDPELETLTESITLFAASPAARGRWSAEIECDLATDELGPFVGGSLAVDGFQGLIFGFVPLRRRRFRCEFEAIAICAGAELYEAGPNGLTGQLIEAEGSDRVWDVGGTIPLLLDGSPGSPVGTIELPHLETSILLYCSTRLRFDFQGRTYRGPLTARAPLTYMHPAPEPPELCLDIRTLAVDYYGRAVVHAQASGCERFDPTLAVSLEAVAGVVTDPGGLGGTASKGLFGPQTALGHRVVFDAFELLGRQPDGAVDTLAIRYVRTSDGRESAPQLHSFGNRRTD